jgi:hypothetical protein
VEKRRLVCVRVRHVSTSVGFRGIFCEGAHGNVTPQDAAKFRAQGVYVDTTPQVARSGFSLMVSHSSSSTSIFEVTVADGNLFKTVLRSSTTFLKINYA